MKNVFRLYLIPLIILFSLSFFSCGKEPVKPAHRQLDPVEFEQVGLEHNKALATVYDALHARKNNPSNIRVSEFTQQEALDLSEETILGYIEENLELSDGQDELTTELVQNIYNHEPVVENNNLYTADVAASLSAGPLQVLDELNAVLSDDDLSLASLQSRISNIEARVPSLNLSEGEQVVVYAAASVSRYTLDYWHTHFDEWAALHFGTTGSKAPFSWKQVGKNDVAGAVSGAVATGVARFFGPVGWAVWGSATLGAAAGASAYDAIMQWW